MFLLDIFVINIIDNYNQIINLLPNKERFKAKNLKVK